MNIAWAHNIGIEFWEEWQLWLAVGWSTLAYGSEIWPWGQNRWAEKAEGFHLKQMLGVGQNTSYEAMCWMTGTLPARDRIWIRAFKFAGRLTVTKEDTVEQSQERIAWETQWTMWDWATDAGRLDMSTAQKTAFGEFRHD